MCANKQIQNLIRPNDVPLVFIPSEDTCLIFLKYFFAFLLYKKLQENFIVCKCFVASFSWMKFLHLFHVLRSHYYIFSAKITVGKCRNVERFGGFFAIIRIRQVWTSLSGSRRGDMFCNFNKRRLTCCCCLVGCWMHALLFSF